MSPANPDTVNSKKNTLRGMRLRDRRTGGGGRWHYTGRVSRSLITPRRSGKYFFWRAYEIFSVVLSFRGDGAHRVRDGTDDPRRRRRRRAPAIHVVLDPGFPDRSERRASLWPSHFRGRKEKPAQPGFCSSRKSARRCQPPDPEHG